MPKKRFSDEQIAFALRQAEAGTTVGEICRKMGIAEATFYRWKKVYAGMAAPCSGSRNFSPPPFTACACRAVRDLSNVSQIFVLRFCGEPNCFPD